MQVTTAPITGTAALVQRADEDLLILREGLVLDEHAVEFLGALLRKV
jgi:hypothetical protein